MGGVTIEGAARPNGWEHCRRKEGCSGESNENRLWDLTPRGELMLGNSMVRSSAGAVMRLGRNMPSAVALDRIPAILNQFVPSARSARPKAPKWGLLFATADFRAVAHNAFLEGGFADGGQGGWRSNRQIELRPLLWEVGGGAQVSLGHWNVAVHLIHRAPEYRVKGQPDPSGMARFVNITVGRANF